MRALVSDDTFDPLVKSSDPEIEAIGEMYDAIIKKADHDRSMTLAILAVLVFRVLRDLRRGKKRDGFLVWFLNYVAAHYHYEVAMVPEGTLADDDG